MIRLCYDDVAVDQHGGGVISLAFTKSGQRNAAFDASVINDAVVPQLFAVATANAPAGTSRDCYIFAGSEARFYGLFSQALEELGLSPFGFRPDSIRRGGATAFFRATGNMSATLERGRWATLRVGRIYVNDGLAKEVELRFSAALTEDLRERAMAVLTALQCWGDWS